MTNEVPDFEKIAVEIYRSRPLFIEEIKNKLESVYLAGEKSGRKAQVKVDCRLVREADNRLYNDPHNHIPKFQNHVSKAIESQVIE